MITCNRLRWCCWMSLIRWKHAVVITKYLSLCKLKILSSLPETPGSQYVFWQPNENKNLVNYHNVARIISRITISYVHCIDLSLLQNISLLTSFSSANLFIFIHPCYWAWYRHFFGSKRNDPIRLSNKNFEFTFILLCSDYESIYSPQCR